MKNINKKKVLITGAASGIGQALAYKFNQLGSKLIIADINKVELEETKASLNIKADCLEYLMDVSNQEHWQNLHKYLEDKNLIPDIIINNAGRSMSHLPIEDLSVEDFKKNMDINFWSVVYGTKEFLGDLLAKETETAIINISSAWGLMACGFAAPYTTSKFAMRGFTETLRQELSGTNVLVSCVHPGGIKTNIAKNALRSENVEITEHGGKATKEFGQRSQTSAQQAADIIIDGILKNKKRILIGNDSKLMDTIARLRPEKYDNFVLKYILKK